VGKAVKIGHGPATVIGDYAVSQDTLPGCRSLHSSRERVRHDAPRVSREAFLFLRPQIETMKFEATSPLMTAANADFVKPRVSRIHASIAALCLVICQMASAGQTSATQAGAAPAAFPGSRELTDEIGRKVQVPREAERIVSLAPNLTEIVFALGNGNRLAGDTDFCDYPAEAAGKPHVGGPVNPNLEEIVALMPDLVLASKSINRRETADALDRIGVPVYITDPHSVEEMVLSVEHIGRAMGAQKSAAALAEDLRARLSGLDRRLVGAAPRGVLFVVWTDPLISIGQDTFIADALRRAGGRSVVEAKAEWPHISLEEIVRLQPEFLVFANAHAADTKHDIDELRTRPGWKNLEAMQRGNVIVVSDAINRPAPRLVDAIEQLARGLHPEAFASRINRYMEFNPVISNPAVEEACLCAR
jgi:iron complex transport system substrate-binding protein